MKWKCDQYEICEGAKSYAGTKGIFQQEAMEHFRKASAFPRSQFIYLSAGVSNAESRSAGALPVNRGLSSMACLPGRAT